MSPYAGYTQETLESLQDPKDLVASLKALIDFLEN